MSHYLKILFCFLLAQTLEGSSALSQSPAVDASLGTPGFLEGLRSLQEKDLLVHQNLEGLPRGGNCFSIWAMNTMLVANRMLPQNIDFEDEWGCDDDIFPLEQNLLRLEYVEQVKTLDLLYKRKDVEISEVLNPYFKNLEALRGGRVTIFSRQMIVPSSSTDFSDFMNKGSFEVGGAYSAKGLAYEIFWKGKGRKPRSYGRHMIGVATHKDEEKDALPNQLWIFDSRKEQLQKIALFYCERKQEWVISLDASSPLIQHLLRDQDPELNREGRWFGKVFRVCTLILKEKSS